MARYEKTVTSDGRTRIVNKDAEKPEVAPKKTAAPKKAVASKK